MHDEIRVRWTSYRVPFGTFGRAFDALLGARIARSSVRDLTQRIVTALETNQRDWRARVA